MAQRAKTPLHIAVCQSTFRCGITQKEFNVKTCELAKSDEEVRVNVHVLAAMP